MADALSDADILEAIARHIGRPGQGPRLTGADIARQPMLDLRIVRCLETRTTREESRPGTYDTSGRPMYEGDLRDHPVEPPKDPAVSRTVELVLRGSVRTVPCGCDGGRQPCSRCRATGKLRCDIGPVCPACKGVDPCTWCDGTGKRRKDRVGVEPAREDPAAGRTACVKCRKPRTACPECQGWGAKKCPRCDDTGFRPCPVCEGERTAAHTPCDGTGLITLWTAGSVKQAPDRALLKLPDPAPPLRVRQQTGRADVWERVTLVSAGDPLPEGLDPAHIKAVGSALVPRQREVARRVDIRWLPLAAVTIPDDPDHVFYVFPGREGAEVLPIWSRRRSLRVAAVVAVVVVLVLLVVALV
ncbi:MULTISPECIES: hypothetical protein [unclassified Streptomyces]|uniref:hypothetical protein n=1 Tax=unclassified Streptomyces TaxID=2593676 RepID=UPI002251CC27|nr:MULTISPECIES: hypothetical protein [unclassified Streptomyces]WSP59320.1 hypothetical protein OG306_36775 [Streptomyces sp. NBC_01241]WSU20160.1 hypothetical protein OG508_03585 [Streptomyces sp. NBC_01108]MCX4791073.1 hypothetical protein [Streptomyces sp. NBC_01221]MCX4793201.1 hypothetical protein [Streptomyces sp. NBC_01242]WSJ34646.1 hypothetical protein OG772_00250 [Streptomyces sp. NBC_01321]